MNKLGFLEVGGHPHVVLHDRGQLLARLDTRADFDAALADPARDRRHDLVVAELLLGVLQLGLQHLDLRLEHAARRGGGGDLGLGGAHVVAARGDVGHCAGARGGGGVHFGLRDRLHLRVVQLAVARGVLVRTHQVGLRLRDLGAGGRRLGLGLLDGGVGLDDLLLHAGDLGLDLVDPDALVGRIELDQHVAGLDHLVIVEHHLGHHARDTGRHRVHVAGHVGVVGIDEIMAVVPHAPACDQRGRGDQANHDQHALGRSLAAVGGDGRGGGAGRHSGRFLLNRGLRIWHECDSEEEMKLVLLIIRQSPPEVKK